MAGTKKLVVNLPGSASGEEVEVLHLGLFENGKTYDLTDEQVERFEATSGRQFPSSGYIVVGVPKTEKQEKAMQASTTEKEGDK